MAGSGRLIDYLGEGLASARPSSLTLVAGGLGIYYATDTPEVSLWDGSAWQTLPSTPGSAAWGSITGTLSAQTDLNTALSGKLGTAANAASATKLNTARTINGVSFDGTANIVAPYEPVTAITLASGVAAINCALGNYFTIAMSAAMTSMTFSNLPASGFAETLMFKIVQDATGTRLATWPSSFKWAGASASVLSTPANSVDLLAITTFDQGTTWDATLAKAFA